MKTTLGNAKMSTLKDKIEEKAVLEKVKVEVEEKIEGLDDKIDEIVGEKKVKIKKRKSK